VTREGLVVKEMNTDKKKPSILQRGSKKATSRAFLESVTSLHPGPKV
jgi:hypothetical protein